MTLIRLNAEGETCRLHNSAQPIGGLLRRMAAGTGPVIVMIHGFSFQPGDPANCPHRHVLSLPSPSQGRCVSSWPRGLGFGLGAPDEGLGIAFGWPARGSLWGARRRAGAAGRALASVLRILGKRAPHRPVHMIAHSMGIEVAAEALHHLPAGAVDRVISMTGASYQSRIVQALNTPAGRQVGFLNITSRENDLFDCLYERLITPPQRADRALGLGLTAPNAVTLQLDCADTLTHLARLGTCIAPPRCRISHWSAYMRPGVLQFYRDFLRHPQALTLGRIGAELPPQVAPRWSRLTPQAGALRPLLFTQKTA